MQNKHSVLVFRYILEWRYDSGICKYDIEKIKKDREHKYRYKYGNIFGLTYKLIYLVPGKKDKETYKDGKVGIKG